MGYGKIPNSSSWQEEYGAVYIRCGGLGFPAGDEVNGMGSRNTWSNQSVYLG